MKPDPIAPSAMEGGKTEMHETFTNIRTVGTRRPGFSFQTSPGALLDHAGKMSMSERALPLDGPRSHAHADSVEPPRCPADHEPSREGLEDRLRPIAKLDHASHASTGIAKPIFGRSKATSASSGRAIAEDRFSLSRLSLRCSGSRHANSTSP